ncbi:unnamed protein product, partial [Brassica oleracea]
LCWKVQDAVRSNEKIGVLHFFFLDDLTGFEITSCSSCISGAITHQADHQRLFFLRYNIGPLRSVLDPEKQEIVLMIRSVEMMMTTSKSSLFQRVKLHLSFASLYHVMCEMNLAKLYFSKESN